MLGMYFTGIVLEQILVLSGVIAILLSVLVGSLAKEARLMSRATIEAVIDAGRIRY